MTRARIEPPCRFMPLLILSCLLSAPVMAQPQAGPATADADREQVPQVPPDHVQRAKQGLSLFRKSVREILEKRCLECHGGNSVKADFDLSTRQKLLDSGYIEKTAGASHLMSLIRHEAEPQMPFKAPKLPAAEIDLIARWIDLGAPYDKPLSDRVSAPGGPLRVTDQDREFWSLRPLTQSPLPPADDWCRTPVDQLIRARQRAAGVSGNPTADRRTLIRRATFDLTGLPPTAAEVDAFVTDTDPDAWEKLIDRLLESPHYGERWARHWMDVARFAESHGYEQDYDRPHAYHYRDFLIQAFNSDLPYDQFLQWQVAGDELAPDNPLALMATGFLGAGVFPTQLTEAEFESARYDELDDMVGTLGVAFLGLSVGCARCHDHKYDPIPTRDYYRLAAVFTSTIRSEVELELDPEENARRRRRHADHLAGLQQRMQQFREQEAPGQFATWLVAANLEQLGGSWQLVEINRPESTGGSQFERLSDGSWLAGGTAPPRDLLTVDGPLEAGRLAAVRLEALSHDSLPQRGPGRAANGNFALGDFRAWIRTSDDGPWEPLELTAARATHQQNSGSLSVAASIDADPVSGWAVDRGGIGKDQAAVFTLASPVAVHPGSHLRVELRFEHPNTRHAVGRLRVSTTMQPDAPVQTGFDGAPPDVVKVLQSLKRNAEVSDSDRERALDWYLSRQPKWTDWVAELDQLKAAGPELKLVKVQVNSEGWPHMKHHADGRGFPHFYPETHQLTRGDVHQKGEVAQPGYLQVLMRPGNSVDDWRRAAPDDWDRTSFRRAALAAWLTDVDHGAGATAARVIVNRLWQHHFGRGIVATPNDFGFQGERPSHPELLDWMALDLVKNGWKLKSTHRLIMLSQTYRQSIEFDAQRALIDRENQLWWRREPRRLEAEAIRDAMLSVSGMLDNTLFGPGSLDPNMRRRSVYFMIKRSRLIPMMVLFDWPEHLVSIGQRPTTTVAPQALMFMNSPQGRSYAEAFATRLPTTDTKQAIREAYRLAFQREPTAAEVKLGLEFLERQQATHSGPLAGQQALTDYCQVLLGMSEFIYVD